MALIYANAVNKRMHHHHGSRMKKRSDCHEDDVDYRRSMSRDAPTRKFCGDLYLKKIAEDEAIRKVSQPVMSLHNKTKCSEMNKPETSKKSVVNKYDLEQHIKKDSKSDSRRRSVSLDPQQWKEQTDEK
ncbi:unnamed protein product [Caenorhabditis bovis]|uniref:Uncharacterized protein n=1 Tax=Caenorhabditis bovis TaxID=2654633 RepID=A0A8S1ELH4_9PELO|nr:unnamed protein product [Caenorhabditis bovis]